MTRRAVALAMLAVAAVASACANSGGTTPGGGTSGATVATPAPAEHPYDGPLDAGPNAAHQDAGAAGNVVDCDTWGGGASETNVPYADGATTDRPEQALHEEGILSGTPDGLRVAKVEADRVLYVLEVNDVVKEAVIVHDGPATEGAGGPGWYVESWAACDASEFSRSYTDSIGLQIWTDAAGRPVPTTKIQAWRGPEHCNWDSMTFLELGKATYVRDAQTDLAEYFADPYQAHAELPDSAVATGYERDGQQLWLSADEQLAYVGTTSDVEVWPREVKPLLCA
jgi:hypothetical protein